MKINLLFQEIFHFSEQDENKFKNFIKKFYHFSNGIYGIRINWITKKVKSLFSLKHKNIYPTLRDLPRIIFL